MPYIPKIYKLHTNLPKHLKLTSVNVLILAHLETSNKKLKSDKDKDHSKNYQDFRAPLLEECPQHHGHKRDPKMMPGTRGAIGKRAQVILVWVRAPDRWERLPPTETRSHEG